jgi:hypothetical protein
MKTLANADDATEIRERMTRLTENDLRCWGRMTVQEMVCHVRDAFEMPLGQRTAARITSTPAMPRRVLKFIALRTPAKWPQGVATVPEVQAGVGGTPPGEFARDVEALLRTFDSFAEATGPFPEHPIFGPMSLSDWKRWGYLHADHHLRQFGR